jgi:YfiH family protein
MIPDRWQKDFDLSSLSLAVVGREGWREKLGVSPDEERLVAAEQVHGARVVEVGGGQTKKTVKAADGLLTREARVWLRVDAADCIPLFLFDDRLRVVGLVHVGWRGLAGGVVEETVKKVCAINGLSPRRLFFILGPSIGGCCWEAGPEVVEIFREKYGEPEGLFLAPAKNFVDLRLACVLSLREAGAAASRLWAPPVCTRCQKERYHSYRGSGGNLEGKNICIIGKT